MKSKFRKLYKNNINKIKSILEGNTDKILHALYKDLNVCIKTGNFEKGIELRQKTAVFEHMLKGRSFDSNVRDSFDKSEQRTESLFELLKKHFPELSGLERIECYDISNLMQKQATASMVVFINGLADKKEYRKFKIKDKQLQSDFDMLEEALSRRFRNKWELPDLIIIDGGKPQVRRVVNTFKKLHISIPIIGIAKHPDRLIIGTSTLPTIRPKQQNYGFQLVQSARDEAHRFARKYHLFLRDKKLLYNTN